MVKNVTINDIKHTRKKFESILAPSFKRIYFTYDQQKIIVDALVYLEYKLKKHTTKENRLLKILHKNSYIGHSVNSCLHSDEDVKNFLLKLSCMNVVNFQNTINAYVDTFNLPSDKSLNINKMLKDTDICLHPEANLATRMFLLRGNFCWNWFPQTDFLELLKHDLSDVPPSAVLNCWEVVMLALFQSNLIDITTLKKAYSSDTPKNIHKMLKSRDVLTIDNIYQKLFKKSCIISFNGLSHVMLNVPFSQKQILKMLITEQFDETPTTSKLFSLWELWTDGKLGTVRKNDFYSLLRFDIGHHKPLTLHDINLK